MLVYFSEQPSQNFTNHKERNDACFGVSLDTIVNEEFDFEKNLALFNKKAFYNKIHKKPDLVPHEKVSNKYKHTENVLHSTPVKFRQVTVPSPAINEYITGKYYVLVFLFTYFISFILIIILFFKLF